MEGNRKNKDQIISRERTEVELSQYNYIVLKTETYKIHFEYYYTQNNYTTKPCTQVISNSVVRNTEIEQCQFKYILSRAFRLISKLMMEIISICIASAVSGRTVDCLEIVYGFSNYLSTVN